jgi:hypothetical protein
MLAKVDHWGEYHTPEGGVRRSPWEGLRSRIGTINLNVSTEGWEMGKSTQMAFPLVVVHVDNYPGVAC